MVQYSYDAYGVTTTNYGNQLNNPYQYNAEYTDSSTGNQYLRARYYDAASGRFLTKDTYLGETNDPLSRNLYTYAQNNPINYVDPSGHFLLAATLIGLGVGALVGAGSNAYKQYKQNNNSFNNFNWGSFAKDTFIGGTVGAVGGAFGGMAFAGMATTFGTAAIGGGVTLTLGQTIGVSAFSSIAGGMASRYVNANLNNAFYGTNRNAAKEAFNPKAMLWDGVVGGTFGGLTYTGNPIYPYGRPQQTKGQQATQKALLERFKKFCDDHGLSKIGKQKTSSPVDIPEETLINNYDYELSGKWENVNEYMSDFSREYQTHVTGRTEESWIQNGVKFDGMKNGVLLDAKGKYSNFVDPNTGEFYNWFSGKDDLLSQANRQIAASEGVAIEWHFAEKDSLNAVKSLFKENGIQGIDLIYDPLK